VEESYSHFWLPLHILFVHNFALPDPAKISNKGQYVSIDARPVSCANGTLKQAVTRYKRYVRAALLRAEPGGGGSGSGSATIKDPFLCMNVICPRGSYDPNIEPAKDDVLFADPRTFLDTLERCFSSIYGELPTEDEDDAAAGAGARPKPAKSQRGGAGPPKKNNAFQLLLARKRTEPVSSVGRSHDDDDGVDARRAQAPALDELPRMSGGRREQAPPQARSDQAAATSENLTALQNANASTEADDESDPDTMFVSERTGKKTWRSNMYDDDEDGDDDGDDAGHNGSSAVPRLGAAGSVESRSAGGGGAVAVTPVRGAQSGSMPRFSGGSAAVAAAALQTPPHFDAAAATAAAAPSVLNIHRRSPQRPITPPFSTPHRRSSPPPVAAQFMQGNSDTMQAVAAADSAMSFATRGDDNANAGTSPARLLHARGPPLSNVLEHQPPAAKGFVSAGSLFLQQGLNGDGGDTGVRGGGGGVSVGGVGGGGVGIGGVGDDGDRRTTPEITSPLGHVRTTRQTATTTAAAAAAASSPNRPSAATPVNHYDDSSRAWFYAGLLDDRHRPARTTHNNRKGGDRAGGGGGRNRDIREALAAIGSSRRDRHQAADVDTDDMYDDGLGLEDSGGRDRRTVSLPTSIGRQSRIRSSNAAEAEAEAEAGQSDGEERPTGRRRSAAAAAAAAGGSAGAGIAGAGGRATAKTARRPAHPFLTVPGSSSNNGLDIDDAEATASPSPSSLAPGRSPHRNRYKAALAALHASAVADDAAAAKRARHDDAPPPPATSCMPEADPRRYLLRMLRSSAEKRTKETAVGARRTRLTTGRRRLLPLEAVAPHDRVQGVVCVLPLSLGAAESLSAAAAAAVTAAPAAAVAAPAHIERAVRRAMRFDAYVRAGDVRSDAFAFGGGYGGGGNGGGGGDDDDDARRRSEEEEEKEIARLERRTLELVRAMYRRRQRRRQGGDEEEEGVGDGEGAGAEAGDEEEQIGGDLGKRGGTYVDVRSSFSSTAATAVPPSATSSAAATTNILPGSLDLRALIRAHNDKYKENV
jgi:hypothetical protein